MNTPIDLVANENSLWREQLSRKEVRFLERVQEFVCDEVAPNAARWEEEEELPRRIFSRAGEVGLMGVTAPTRLGGQGLGYVAYALAVREVARQQAALAIDIAAHNALVVGHILSQGSRAQHQRVFPQLLTGDWMGAWALTEPEAGSDSGGLQTRAVEGKGGGWVLNGFKRYITMGRVADILVVMARSGDVAPASGNAPAKPEISAFLVKKSEITPQRKVPTCGLRASETSEFKLVNSHGELLGTRGAGQSAALACLDKGRIGVAAVSLGLGRAALDAALAHVPVRRQFGRRLSEFQSIQFMLADCETELHAAEALVLEAAILADRGARHSRESSIAKLFASEAASRICNRSLQIHGGYGYTRDIPVERFWRDARLSEIGEGSSEVQRIVISRAMLTRPAPRA